MLQRLTSLPSRCELFLAISTQVDEELAEVERQLRELEMEEGYEGERGSKEEEKVDLDAQGGRREATQQEVRAALDLAAPRRASPDLDRSPGCRWTSSTSFSPPPSQKAKRLPQPRRWTIWRVCPA